jgi:hypothetical protein
MKSKRFEIAVVLIVLLIGPCTVARAQEKKNGIFSVTPAVSFAWYPYVNFLNEKSTETEVDLNNFGMSVIMSLKLFDKVGAHLNLKIDDPTFEKLVDVAGYITAYYFMLKFDYHSFGGTVTWVGNTPNPIPGDTYNFRNQWNNVSLLFRIDQLQITNAYLWDFLNDFGLIGAGNLGAIGIGYARFDMPLEYRVLSDGGLSNPGFGLVKGKVWGLSILWDTLSWNMERPASYKRNLADYIWIYLDVFLGGYFWPFESIGKGETDAQAIAWMSSTNNGVSVDGNINRNIRHTILKGTLGLQYVWDVGKKSRIGLAVGAEILEESISAHNDDINIGFGVHHIGPAVRVSAYW